MSHANARAWELRARLFALVGEFKGLAVELGRAGADDATVEAASQASAAGCALADVYARLSGPSAEWPLFVDAARDDPEFAAPLGLVPGFDTRLKSVRSRTAMSLDDLANAAGVTKQSLSLYERGERRPTWDAVQKIAAALKVPTDTFRDA